jgi:hypothetical protein
MTSAPGLKSSFNLWKLVATKFFARKELEEKMEAKDQDTIELKDEMEFFILIEQKLEQNGFKVLETMPLAVADLPVAKPEELHRSR